MAHTIAVKRKLSAPLHCTAAWSTTPWRHTGKYRYSCITFWTLQLDGHVQLNCEHSPSTHTKLLLFNPCKWYLGTKHAGVVMKFEICIPEAEMSRNVKRFWLLTDRNWLLNLHLSSLRISVHSTVTECKEELHEEMHTNILWPQLYRFPVTHTPETKRSLTWTCEKYSMYSFQNLVRYKVTLASLLTTLYRNKHPNIYNSKHSVFKLIMYTTHHTNNLKAQQITGLSSSGSDRIIIKCCMFRYIRCSFYFKHLQQKLTLFLFSQLLFLLLFSTVGFRFNKGTTERIIRLHSRLIEILGFFLLFLLLLLSRLWKWYKP